MSSLIVSLATKAPRTISFRCAAPFVPATSSLVSFPWQLSVGDINCRSVRHFADSTKGSNEPPFKVTDKEEEEQLEEAMKDVASKTKINTKDLYKHIAEINDLNKNQSKRFVDSLFDTIADAVANGQQVSISGFGTFKSVQSKARSGRNPITGAKLEIPSKNRVKFTPYTEFKEAVLKGKSSATDATEK